MQYDTGYAAWKGWNTLFQLQPNENAYFNGEFADIEIAGRRVFEVGFGSGQFIAWAARNGAQIHGCEMTPELVDRGKQLGYDVRLGDAREVMREDEQFDVVALFDVLEHIEPTSCIDLLRFLFQHLSDGGVLIVRTPNGESPFGRFWQHGDITHVATLSCNKFRQLADMTGYRFRRCGNQFRVARPDSGYWGHRDRVRFWLRDRMQSMICFAYDLGNRPLDLNIVVVLEKPTSPPQKECRPESR